MVFATALRLVDNISDEAANPSAVLTPTRQKVPSYMVLHLATKKRDLFEEASAVQTRRCCHDFIQQAICKFRRYGL